MRVNCDIQYDRDNECNHDSRCSTMGSTWPACWYGKPGNNLPDNVTNLYIYNYIVKLK